jgi:GMP synthase-like glutamine amidotransferase
MRILVLQHLDVEGPGAFGEFWTEAGFEQRVVELDEGEAIPDLDGFDLMAVMGGPMDVWEEDAHPWLKAEKAAIRRWVKELGRPYLGICLGHQLLGAALGGEVGPMKAKPEVGLHQVELTAEGARDPLFAGLGPTVDVLQWHGAEVALPPEGATVLARSPACPVQAMRWGSVAYGLQFHPEVVAQTVEDWRRIPEYWASLNKALGPKEAEALGLAVIDRLPKFRQTARTMERNLAAVWTAAVKAA